MIITEKRLRSIIRDEMISSWRMSLLYEGASTELAVEKLIDAGHILPKHKKKAEWGITKIENAAAKKIPVVGSLVSLGPDIANTITIFNLNGPEEAAKYASMNVAWPAIKIGAGAALGNAMGFGAAGATWATGAAAGSIIGGAILGAVLMVPSILYTEMMELYDPYERLLDVYNNIGNRIEGTKTPKAIDIGHQIKVPSKSSSVPKTGIMQNPLYGISQDILVTGNASRVKDWKRDGVISQATLDYVTHPRRALMGAKSLQNYAKSIFQNPSIADNMDDDTFDNLKMLIQVYYKALWTILWDDNRNKKKMMTSESFSRFGHLTKRLARAVDELNVDRGTVRKIIDRKFTADGWKERREKGLAGYLIARINSSGGMEEDYFTQAYKEYTRAFPTGD